jgi:hypothetical protein
MALGRQIRGYFWSRRKAAVCAPRTVSGRLPASNGGSVTSTREHNMFAKDRAQLLERDFVDVRSVRRPSAAAVRKLLRGSKTLVDLPTVVRAFTAAAVSAPERPAAETVFLRLLRRPGVALNTELIGLWKGWQPDCFGHASPIGSRKAGGRTWDYYRDDTVVAVTRQQLIIGRSAKYGIYGLTGGRLDLDRRYPVAGPLGVEPGFGIRLHTPDGDIGWRGSHSRFYLGIGCVDRSLLQLLALLFAGIAEESAKPQPVEATTSRPLLRLIRTPSDAEAVAAEWMTYFGFGTAATTPVGRDEGIDVVAERAVAQVKMEGLPTGRPVVQQLFGASMAEGKVGLLFSLAGYTAEARAWADRVGVALFRFDLQGEPEPVNATARALLS